MRGKIKVFYFTESTDDDVSIENLQDHGKNPKNLPSINVNSQEVIKPRLKEQETTVKCASLVGHSGPITC